LFNEARIWDPRTGAQLAEYQQLGEIMDVRWNRDGARLLTTSSAGTVRTWDVRRDGRSVAELEDFVTEHVPFRLVDGRLEISK
jgi:WD40 repeat protein